MSHRFHTFSIILLLGTVLAGCSRDGAPAPGKDISLRFNGQGKFKIVQLTDTHLCWDRHEEFVKALEQQHRILEAEKPDLVIFTGDVVTDVNADSAWVDFLKPLDDMGIPFVVTLGNHDREQNLTERQLASMVMSHPMSLNTAKEGRLDDLAVEVKSSKGDKVAALLYCMDSGDYVSNEQVESDYGWFGWDQVEWYRHTSFEYSRANGGVPVPAYAFFHIPLLEYRETFDSGKIVSGVREEAECPGELNTGLFSAFAECGDVHGVFAGHDHVNDYVVERDDVYLIYGRFSGRNTSYHNLPFGYRVIELTEGDYGLRTWIHEDEGEIVQTDTLKVAVDYSLHKAAGGKGKTHGLECTEFSGDFTEPEDILSGSRQESRIVATPYMPKKLNPASHGYLFSGKLLVPESGVWFIHGTAYDTGTIRIDDWTISGKKQFQGRVNLEKGLHDISIILANKGSKERMRVQWRRLDEARYRDIPEESFFTD